MSKVLLVEDDPDVSDTLRGLLAAFGFEVRVANDGNSAMRELRGGYVPNVILLDLMMPNMDGQRFREIQLDDPSLCGIPTVVITADARADAATLRVAACFRKPFDPAELLDTIRSLAN